MAERKGRGRLSNAQIIFITLLWLFFLGWLLASVERVDGMLVIMVMISGALVFIPIAKELKKRSHEAE